MSYKYLATDEILRLHFQVVQNYGGRHGIRDEGRLKSVVEAPAQNVFGAEQYPSLFEKAAVYFHNIIGDHPFIDGNKRTGLTSCAVFLLKNNYRLTASPQNLEDFTVSIAADHLDIQQIAAWLELNTKQQ